MKRAMTFLFFLLLIIFPKISIEGARQGLILWGFTLVPTLLPFFIATRSMLQYNIPGKFLLPYLLFVGYFCGYPTGAVIIDQLYQSQTITEKQANLLICFCNHTSPAFLLNFVYYHYFQSQCTVYKFLLPIYLSAILWSVIFYFLFDRPKLSPVNVSITAKTQSLEEIFTESIAVIMKIGCFMVIFSICIQISFSLFMSRSVSCCILSCFLEITSGIHYLSSCPISNQLKTALIGALCSFGGYCSIAQVQSVLSKELSLVCYVLFKLCTGITVFLLFYLLF